MFGSIKYMILLVIVAEISATEDFEDLKEISPIDDFEDLKEISATEDIEDLKEISAYPKKELRESDDALEYFVSVQNYGNHICSGAVVSERFVITTARCVINFQPGSLSLRIAGNTRLTGGVLTGVKKVIIHPDFCPETLDSNLALLEVLTPLVLTESGDIQRVYLPKPKSSVDSGIWSIFYGYSPRKTGMGKYAEKLSRSCWRPQNFYYIESGFEIGLSKKLRESSILTISNEACRTALPKKIITKNMFCTTSGSYRSNECLRDSGSPFVVKNELLGIFSWTDDCYEPSSLNVYVDVSQFVPWMLDIIVDDN